MQEVKLPNQVFVVRGLTLFAVGLILYLAFQVMRPFLGILATGTIVAVFLNPLYQWLRKKIGNSAYPGFLTVTFFFLFILVPLILLLTNLIGEVVSVTQQLQEDPEWLRTFQLTVRYYAISLQIPLDYGAVDFGGQISQLLSFLARNVGDIALRSISFVFNLFFTLLTIYFLLVNQSKIRTYVYQLGFLPRAHLDRLVSRAAEIINGTVRGYLIVLVLQMVVGIVGFLIFRISAVFLLGSLYGFSSLLPVVGGFLIWVPVVLWQIVQGNVLVAALMTVWFFGLSFLVENILTPRIIGRSTKLHQLIVMFSVFGGIRYFGLLGMVMGPVVIALMFIALEIVRDLSQGGD